MIIHAVVDTWQYDGGHVFLKGYSGPNAATLALIELQRVRRALHKTETDYREKYKRVLTPDPVHEARLQAAQILEIEIEET